MYKLILAPGVTEQLMNLAPFTRRKIEQVFSELIENPYTCFEAARMRGGSFTRYRCKTGDHRIIYNINDNKIEVYVLKIGHRGTVYE